ncbi:MAG: lipoate--protein ligase family protein [Candidatus Bipolaricaulota bacterium]
MENNSPLRTITDLRLRRPELNIALEEAIARNVSSGLAPPTLRFWRNGNAAILGRSQTAEVELELSRCRDLGVPVIRRPSGGGTVLHHPKNLNYSLYLPESGSGTVREETIRLSRPVAEVLEEAGFTTRVKTNGFFVKEGKVGGTAQTRRWGLLHHGTLLMDNSGIMDSMEVLLRAGKENYEQLNPKLPSRPSKVVNLRELLGGTVGLEELVEGLYEEFAKRLDLTPISGGISEREWKYAKRLMEGKYSSRVWTFRFADEGVKELGRTE